MLGRASLRRRRSEGVGDGGGEGVRNEVVLEPAGFLLFVVVVNGVGLTIL